MHPLTPPGQVVDVSVDGHPMKIHAQIYPFQGETIQDAKLVVLLDGSVAETSFDWDKVATKVHTLFHLHVLPWQDIARIHCVK
jgi:hypothetical protein